MSTRLGTLGFHLDGRPCKVKCEFCYLGARPVARERSLDGALAADIVRGAAARDVAVAISEPASIWRAGLEKIAAAAEERGLPLAVTTTQAVVEDDPWVIDGAARLTLSIDESKGVVDVARLERTARAARARRPALEIVALVSLATPAFCERLAAGLVRELVETPAFDAVALNGLKPPPAWCDTKFWVAFLARLRPLLDRHLGSRLHLDCYVSARILGLSGCPAKPDVTAGREFRACVYQKDPDFVFADARSLLARVADYQAPTQCPFPIL